MENSATVSQLKQEVEELRAALEVSQAQLQDLHAVCRLLTQAITAHAHYNQTKGQQLKKKRRKSGAPAEEAPSGKKRGRKSQAEQAEKTPSKRSPSEAKTPTSSASAVAAASTPTTSAQSSSVAASSSFAQSTAASIPLQAAPPPAQGPQLKKQPSLADAIPDPTAQLQQMQAIFR